MRSPQIATTSVDITRTASVRGSRNGIENVKVSGSVRLNVSARSVARVSSPMSPFPPKT
jgi:hypothetical protein